MTLYQVSYQVYCDEWREGNLYTSEEEAIKEKDFIMQNPKKYLGSGNWPVTAKIIIYEVQEKFDSNTIKPVY